MATSRRPGPWNGCCKLQGSGWLTLLLLLLLLLCSMIPYEHARLARVYTLQGDLFEYAKLPLCTDSAMFARLCP